MARKTRTSWLTPLRNALYLFEEGVKLAKTNSFDKDASLRLGLTMALSFLGVAPGEIEEASNLIIDVATRLASEPESEAIETDDIIHTKGTDHELER